MKAGRGSGRGADIAAMALALALFAVLIGVAAAQAPENVDQIPVDTEFTPKAKDGETMAWEIVAGLPYGATGVGDSPTPAGVDFFSVAFRDDATGIAGGWSCADPDAALDTLEGCERFPALYEFGDFDGTGAVWRRAELEGGDRPGFIGAVAWLGDGRALAVGGDGRYPRREHLPSAADPAGNARAWLLENGTWRELREPEMQPGMRGLTALAVSPLKPATCQAAQECAIAGGFQQLWMWRDGGFVKGYSRDSTDAEFSDHGSFRFRVRDIRFDPNLEYFQAYAVTSGCCSDNPHFNQPRLLILNTTGDKWAARTVNRDDSFALNQSALRDARGHQTIADSYFATLFSSRPGGDAFSVVATPGGNPPAEGAEAASRIYAAKFEENPAAPGWDAFAANLIGVGSGGYGDDPTGNLFANALEPNLSSLRLVSADGDSGPAPLPPSSSFTSAPPKGSDGIVDWAVGELTSTGEGVAWTTLEHAKVLPYPVTCNVFFNGGNPTTDRDCQPEPGTGTVDKMGTDRLYSLGTHRVNALRFVGSSGVGWAVGDRGAILRLGAVSGIGSGGSSGSATLGPAESDEFADISAYDAFRPVTVAAEPGLVPPLLSQPLRDRTKPAWTAHGSADPARLNSPREESISSVVFSRDGAQAWAVGGVRTPVLHHYDGERWSRCQIDEVEGQVPADPACAALQDLKAGGVELVGAARVPVEFDDDPTNDDEFEIVAIGTNYVRDDVQRFTVVRFRDGRWSHDTSALAGVSAGASLHQVLFTAPNDGWIAGGSVAEPVLYHFDGTAWHDCVAKPADCGFSAAVALRPAVPRVYLSAAGRTLFLGGTREVAGPAGPEATYYPFIFRKEPGQNWTTEGGFNPVSGNDTSQQGKLDGLSVARDGDGFVGWASGRFGRTDRGGVAKPPEEDEARAAAGYSSHLLRLRDGAWSQWSGKDATSQYLPRMIFGPQVLTLPERGGEAILAPTAGTAVMRMPLLRYDPGADRWRVIPTPFNTARAAAPQSSRAAVSALALDAGGGLWTVIRDSGVSVDETIPGAPNVQNATWYYRHSLQARAPVFEEVPHPIREEIRATAGNADGTLLVATASNMLYRYDRLAGWSSLEIPGWQAGRTVTRRPQARAVAIGPDGKGLVVGESGRIADVTGFEIRLDAAAGKLCEAEQAAPPCGTNNTLNAAAIAPDGSALVGGERRSLLWRPANDDFRPITPPKLNPTAAFTGIAMPAPTRAYIATDSGQIFRGDLDGENQWDWALENKDATGIEVLSLDENRRMPIQAIAVDADGQGYAVGNHGLVLERTGDGERPWRRLVTGYRDNFFTVALPLGGGEGGAVIGGQGGTILTLVDGRFHLVRAGDPYDPLFSGTGGPGSLGRVASLALMPGVEPGQVEAWAAVQSHGGREPRPQAMLHYSSDPDEPLLDPRRSVDPLPDTPEPRPGEISFAAFGRTQCVASSAACSEPVGSNLTSDVLTRAIADGIIDASKRPGGPAFAMFTGDISESAGRNGWRATEADTPLDDNVMQDRWAELVPPLFKDAGVPLYGALGRNDLSLIRQCPAGISRCADNAEADVTRTNLPWRRSMASMPAPWGLGDAPRAGDLLFKGVSGGGKRVEDQTIAVPVPGSPAATVPSGGANTHYAFDMTHEQTGEVAARIVVVDSSMRSMNVSEREQQPVEPGGQATWLESMLCKVGDQVAGAVQPCSRAADVPVIVVTNTPTYSYGPGTATDTQTDAAAFETILFRHGVSAVVSGRLGWNAKYFATAPGVHEPCPGGTYPQSVPEPGARVCGRDQEQVPVSTDPNETAARVAEAVDSLAPPAAPIVDEAVPDDVGVGVIPFAIAGGGGPFADPAGTASDGYWHGYSVIRVDASGDPRATIIEQRPVFDWIGIEAGKHILRAGEKMTLRGFGREPVGLDQPMRYNRIDSPAITHRYDLVKADPKRPYLPARDADGDYIPLPSSVAYVEQDGKVTTGKGNQERTYAIAILSVGDKAASYPIAFEPRKSFKPKPQVLLPAPQPPRIPASRPLPAPIVLGTAPASLPPQAPPPSSPPPVSINVQAPAPPSLPGPGPTTAATLAPPPPPAPPAPPGSAPPSALTLSLGATGINVGSQSSVVPPPAPPIQPAPPGGARKEARQRQAAAAKSEEGGGGESSEKSSSEGGGANSFTRYEFTALRRPEGGSMLGRGALYGGSMTLAALLLSLTWTAARPRDRRREPELPAPAYVRRDRY